MQTNTKNRPRRKAKQQHDVYFTFDVILVPNGNMDDAHEPAEVVLGFSKAEADLLDVKSKAVINEAFRRAIAIEARDHGTPAETQFFNGGTRLKKKALARSKAPSRR